MFGVSLSEIIVIAIVGVLLFGKHLPEIAHQLGKLFHKVQKGFQDIKNEIDLEDK